MSLPYRQGERIFGAMTSADTLPDWPSRTIAVLSTVDAGPHAIPVSAPVRAGDHRILFNLHRDRGSLARLRTRPEVALESGVGREWVDETEQRALGERVRALADMATQR